MSDTALVISAAQYEVLFYIEGSPGGVAPIRPALSNSGPTLRACLRRGLIELRPDSADSRGGVALTEFGMAAITLLRRASDIALEEQATYFETEEKRGMVTPTIGRIVHYNPSANEGLARIGTETGSQPLAAIITGVWSDSCVNLAVFDANGAAHCRTSVLLVQGDAQCPDAGFAAWPPR